jgi:hypothetical protein
MYLLKDISVCLTTNCFPVGQTGEEKDLMTPIKTDLGQDWSINICGENRSIHYSVNPLNSWSQLLGTKRLTLLLLDMMRIWKTDFISEIVVLPFAFSYRKEKKEFYIFYY